MQFTVAHAFRKCWRGFVMSWLCLARAGDPAGPGVPAGGVVLRVPDGFTIERVAGPPQIRFPMFGAFDDRGRLFVTESGGGDLYEDLLKQRRTCRVSLLADNDGDGRFEQHQVFAQGFVPAMGVAWRAGRLYVADPPDLVALEDADGDGRAERRTVILSGFGHTDNGSLHGLVFGPDGWLHMTMGWPDGYQLEGRDRVRVSGKTGAWLRCRPDGSSPQALARGFDQLIELVFLPGGETLGSQTWYQNPSGGIRDSLTHLVPGGHYPQRWPDEEPPVFVTGDTLPAVLMLPAIAHSGIVLYRGGQFPASWRGHIFSAQFNTRRVVRHPLLRQGASFSAESEPFVTTDDPDFRPADVLEDADGSLLILDTGSWYVQHCPTGRMRPTSAPGAIYRVRRSGHPAVADPWGTQLAWENATTQELARRLVDSRFAVRDRAVECLVMRGPAAVPGLRRELAQCGAGSPHVADLVWTLARIGGEEALETLRETLTRAAGSKAAPAVPQGFDSQVVCALARSLALHADTAAASALEQLLQHGEAAVRLAAAEGLSPCGRRESVPAVLQALAARPDRMLEHALILALHRHASVDQLRAGLAHPDPVVQQAVLLVLDQAPRLATTPEDVLPRLRDAHEPLRRAALFCLRRHPEWAAHALDFIRQELRSGEATAARQAALLPLLQAFASQPDLVSTLGTALRETDATVPPAHKVFLLRFMAEHPRPAWPPEWTDAVAAALRHPDALIGGAAIRAASAAGTNAWPAELWALARSTGHDAALRVEALAALARWQPRLDTVARQFLVEQLRAPDSTLLRLRAAEVLVSAEMPPDVVPALVEAARAEPSIPPQLVLMAGRRAGISAAVAPAWLEYLTASVQRGWAATPAQLEWVPAALPESAKALADPLLRAVRDQATQQRALLLEYEPVLASGDPVRGRGLFFGKASCGTCHQVGSEGRAVGPDLTKVGAIRSGLDILESVLLPSATFAQGYDTYMAETRDGESVSGSLVRETPEFVVLRNTSGAEVRLPRREVESLNKSQLSMMPEGLLQALTRTEAADLLAFLQDLK